MNVPPSLDYAHRLRSHMQSVGISSFAALSQTAGVSKWQVQQLRQGKAAQMRVETLYRLSHALHVPITQLITDFSDLPPSDQESGPTIHSSQPTQETSKLLEQEYQRLQTQLAQQRETLWHEFQRSTLQTIESWLIQFPTAAYAAQQNPELSATKLLPLMRPIEQLLKDWQVEAIAPVGSQVPYDPHLHELLQGTAQPNDPVKIRNPGYRQGDCLLYRAKVSPV